MQLAGEAGSLLKIEEEIRDAIDQARREWQKLAIHQRDLFSAAELAALGGVGSSLNTDLQNLTKDFWIDIEERIYAALSDYADQAESGGYQRRLFAEDAAQGFAFIDVCRRRYDVVVMNPPFGEWSKRFKINARICFPYSFNDMLAAFIERSGRWLSPMGRIGAITSRSCFFLTSFGDWREHIVLGLLNPVLLADLGLGVMDAAMVEAAAYVLQLPAKGMTREKLVTFRLNEAEDPAPPLSEAIKDLGLCRRGECVRVVDPFMFNALPNAPLAYWLSKDLLKAFVELPPFESGDRVAKRGINTNDDFRFLRLSWEVISGLWVDHVKGGEFSRFYADPLIKVKWGYRELVAERVTEKIYKFAIVPSKTLYFRPGFAWSLRTQSGLSFRALPKGCIFGSKGPAVVVEKDDPERLLAYMAIANSSVFSALAEVQTAFGSYEVGVIQKTPFPDLLDTDLRALAGLAKDAWQQKFIHDCWNLTSHRFVAPFLRRSSKSVNGGLAAYSEANESLDRCLRARLKDINDLASSIYGIQGSNESDEILKIASKGSGECEQHGQDFDAPSGNEAIKDFLDYAVGVVFGRWDIRYATEELNPPELPEPFDALPAYPPGSLLYSEPRGSIVFIGSGVYPVEFSLAGVLVDDPRSREDISYGVSKVVEAIWGVSASSMQGEMVSSLGSQSLSEWFRRPANFSADHLGRHSKSRRQAPLYWQLSAGNGNYSAWLYYHRFTSDTLYRLLGDFVEIRIQEAEREQFELESQGGLSGDAASLLQEAQTLLQDLRLFKSELELVAPLWNPNLNDGVIINHAILWRITPYTPWQKKCKECWDKLVKGDYDWAHLAFHLWPERVIRKCTTDRSLAIAHGLEERLWQDTNNGNWLQRQVSEAELQGLIAGYSKPAVQNALERFLSASPPVAAARTRAPRAAKSSSTGTTRRPRGSAPEVDAETSRQTLLVLTAAPAEGFGRNAIAELLDVEAASLTAVIKQLKEGGQIQQLGAARGAKYRLSESGLASVESQAGEDG